MNQVVCRLNSATARQILSSLNPTVNFQAGDINRIPLLPIERASDIVATLESAFTQHESHREPSVEYKSPGPSPWKHAQEWAQIAVDRPEGAPLPAYAEILEPPPATDPLSYALGLALGRFPSENTLPAGILFLDLGSEQDSLNDPAAAPLLNAWAIHASEIAPRRSLKEYLAHDFFKDVHRPMYENRPIHWPLSSASRSFVAWINIHRWTGQTLRILLADHLWPALARVEGELADLRVARDGADKKAAREAERVYDKRQKAREELTAFIADVAQCADRGPLPTDAKCPKVEVEARYTPVLDDGVMINSAALWKLLEPQWKDPKKWWKELASAEGKKDYDWSQLARCYFPRRVNEKCKSDPSLGVAHGCFWRYHPGRAWAWELRLQEEIGGDFRIEEADDGACRAHYLREQAPEAIAAIEKEALRRGGRGKDRRPVGEMRILEVGLWVHPVEIWAMELRVAEKQGADFCLRAPDEMEARSIWVAAHREAVTDRSVMVAGLRPLAGLYDAVEEEIEGGEEE